MRPGDLSSGSLMATMFHFWELDEGGRIAAQRRYQMPGFAFLHDFVVGVTRKGQGLEAAMSSG